MGRNNYIGHNASEQQFQRDVEDSKINARLLSHLKKVARENPLKSGRYLSSEEIDKYVDSLRETEVDFFENHIVMYLTDGNESEHINMFASKMAVYI